MNVIEAPAGASAGMSAPSSGSPLHPTPRAASCCCAMLDADLAALYDVQTKALVQGVAMLSSMLGSTRAIGVNIEIIRTFVRVRAPVTTHQDLAKRLAELEEKTELIDMRHDSFSRNTRNQLRQVFDAIKALTTTRAARAAYRVRDARGEEEPQGAGQEVACRFEQRKQQSHPNTPLQQRGRVAS
ncbi:hypothetical protein [Variovorax sp. ZT4R33]|uniref:hypothetical protein n=1 Tax=Variovorax sp. ZT4R33 TaxID=3443743 RepID=UPI003F481484